MMRIGLDLAVNDPPERFGRVVRAVERGGFEALWLVDNGLWGRDLFVHLGWAAVLSVDPGERIATLCEEILDPGGGDAPPPGGATGGG